MDIKNNVTCKCKQVKYWKIYITIYHINELFLHRIKL